MPTDVQCSTAARDTELLHSDTVRYLARQPILEKHGVVQAYELLYRQSPSTGFAGDGVLATQTMIDNAVLFGLHSLTHSRPAFVNCNAAILTGEQIRVLPARITVLEILEDVEPTSDVVEACKRLRQEGYQLALDDFVYRPELEPLIQIADYIKIDYRNTTRELRQSMFARLAKYRRTLLAEKIETQSEFDEACKDGCTLFQGYYFCSPTVLTRRKVPGSRVLHLRLLQMLQKDPLNLREISESISSEPSIAYRLLRYANSPLWGRRDPITSIESAILVLGDEMTRRIGTLAVASQLNSGRSPEVLRIALVRARFCEFIAGWCSLNATEQHLMGLFSLLPAMLQKPMEEALADLPLPRHIRAALLGEKNLNRFSLDWLGLQERGEFEQAEAIARVNGLDGLVLAEKFVLATLWADQLLAE